MLSDKKIILIITLLSLLILPLFYLHQGLLIDDTGREFFIPSQILNNKILFKDIFNIYGALSYQFNAFLFLLFGQKLSTLIFSGIFHSLTVLITLYLLAREFLNKPISFLFIIFVMFALVFQTFLYNSVITYSYAIIYALSAFLLSVLFLLKFLKNSKTLFLYLACFFAGISIANKYEFLLYLPILAYSIKNITIVQKIKSLLCFILVPFISYSILFLQGLTCSDLKESIHLIKEMLVK